MSFELAVSSQSETVFANVQANLYKSIHAASLKKCWIRFTGLGVGITSALLAIAMRVSAIAENLFKGIVNIVRGEIIIGLNQLLFRVTGQIIYLPFTTLRAVIYIFADTLFMLCKPIEYSYTRWCQFDSVERNANDQRIKAYEQQQKLEKIEQDRQTQLSQQHAEQKQLIDRFLTNLTITQQQPNNIIALKYVGWAYSLGIGVEQNPYKAFEYCKRAADLGDEESNNLVQPIIKRNQDEATFKTLKQEAEAGDADAILGLGRCYENGIGVSVNQTEAFRCYSKAILAGKEEATDALYQFARKILFEKEPNKENVSLVKTCFVILSGKKHLPSIHFLALSIFWCEETKVDEIVHWMKRAKELDPQFKENSDKYTKELNKLVTQRIKYNYEQLLTKKSS